MAKKKLTAEILARLMSEELDRDYWGSVEPDDFRGVAEARGDLRPNARALREVLIRVVGRINFAAKAEGKH